MIVLASYLLAPTPLLIRVAQALLVSVGFLINHRKTCARRCRSGKCVRSSTAISSARARGLPALPETLIQSRSIGQRFTIVRGAP